MEARYSTIFSTDHRPVSAVISFSDITERLEKEVVYSKWQQSLAERPENSYTLFRCNLSKNASFDSREGTLIGLQFERERATFNERTAEYAQRCVYAEDLPQYIAFMNSDSLLAGYYRGSRSHTLEYREKAGEGVRWIRLTVDLVEYPTSRDVEAYLMYEDIDERKKAELLTLELSKTDPLTGVLNRSTFIARTDEIIAASKPDALHALFMLDVDAFKHINDTLGHGAGDRVLLDTTERIRASLRPGDFIGRLGGDEFFLFLRDVSGREAVAEMAEEVVQKTNQAIEQGVKVSCSVGIALCPDDGTCFDTLYLHADDALYQVKRSGKAHYAFYQADART